MLKGVLLFLVTLGMMLNGCSTLEKWRTHRYDRDQYLKEHKIVELPRADIPLVINNRVIAWMEYFQGPGRKHFERYLERSGRYRPLMEQILKEEGMPTDLIYVSLIESGFNPHAYSRAHAVGAWQFIHGTGKRYGLKIDAWVDERRHLDLSTRAAAAYLKDLHDEFNDWYLAMAAYNAGEGKIRRAIRQYGTRDFWELTQPGHRHLRPETRDYVPKYIAAAMMAKAPEKFGFQKVKYEKPEEYDTVVVDTQTDLSVVAKCAGVKTTEVRELNPHLVRLATPFGEKNYEVRVPKGRREAFQVAFAAIPQDQRITVVYHTVQRGDSLYAIGRRYGVTASDIARTNRIHNKRRIYPGQKLVIPLHEGASLVALNQRVSSSSGTRSDEGTLVRYRVQSGETLGGIAQRHGVTISQLKHWNDISNPAHLRAGKSIKIYKRGAAARVEVAADGEKTYTVRSGDSLWSISRRHRVGLNELLAMNGLNRNSKIIPGQKLYLQKTEVAEVSKESMQLASAEESSTSYRVRRGDTLWEIARRHKVRVSDLKAWNDLRGNAIHPGKTLLIKNSIE